MKPLCTAKNCCKDAIKEIEIVAYILPKKKMKMVIELCDKHYEKFKLGKLYSMSCKIKE